jgi:hypothetical protein
MAPVILATKLQQGRAFMPGAQVCMGILGLSDFEPEFTRWNMSSRLTDTLI